MVNSSRGMLMILAPFETEERTQRRDLQAFACVLCLWMLKNANILLLKTSEPSNPIERLCDGCPSRLMGMEKSLAIEGFYVGLQFAVVALKGP